MRAASRYVYLYIYIYIYIYSYVLQIFFGTSDRGRTFLTCLGISLGHDRPSRETWMTWKWLLLKTTLFDSWWGWQMHWLHKMMNCVVEENEQSGWREWIILWRKMNNLDGLYVVITNPLVGSHQDCWEFWEFQDSFQMFVIRSFFLLDCLGWWILGVVIGCFYFVVCFACVWHFSVN